MTHSVSFVRQLAADLSPFILRRKLLKSQFMTNNSVGSNARRLKTGLPFEPISIFNCAASPIRKWCHRR